MVQSVIGDCYIHSEIESLEKVLLNVNKIINKSERGANL